MEKKRILVVEREPLIALDIESAVSAKLGDAPHVYLSLPADSLDIGERFDIVTCDADAGAHIVDYWVQRVREISAALVITSSADADELDRADWPVLRKPFDSDSLASALDRALALRKNRQSSDD